MQLGEFYEIKDKRRGNDPGYRTINGADLAMFFYSITYSCKKSESQSHLLNIKKAIRRLLDCGISLIFINQTIYRNLVFYTYCRLINTRVSNFKCSNFTVELLEFRKPFNLNWIKSMNFNIHIVFITFFFYFIFNFVL